LRHGTIEYKLIILVISSIVGLGMSLIEVSFRLSATGEIKKLWLNTDYTLSRQIGSLIAGLSLRVGEYPSFVLYDGFMNNTPAQLGWNFETNPIEIYIESSIEPIARGVGSAAEAVGDHGTDDTITTTAVAGNGIVTPDMPEGGDINTVGVGLGALGLDFASHSSLA